MKINTSYGANSDMHKSRWVYTISDAEECDLICCYSGKAMSIKKNIRPQFVRTAHANGGAWYLAPLFFGFVKSNVNLQSPLRKNHAFLRYKDSYRCLVSGIHLFLL